MVQLLGPETVPLLEREDLGAQLAKGGDHAGARFEALAEAELAKGAGSLAADQQRLQDLGQGSLRGTGATGCAVSDEEVRTHSAGNPPFLSRTPPW